MRVVIITIFLIDSAPRKQHYMGFLAWRSCLQFGVKTCNSLASILSAASVAVKLALLGSSAVSYANDDQIERISVYGKHNEIILQSGTATKSNMDLMQTPAAVVVVDKSYWLLKVRPRCNLLYGILVAYRKQGITMAWAIPWSYVV